MIAHIKYLICSLLLAFCFTVAKAVELNPDIEVLLDLAKLQLDERNDERFDSVITLLNAYLPEYVDSAQRVQLLRLEAEQLYRTRKYPHAFGKLDEALNISKILGDSGLIGATYHVIGYKYWGMEDALNASENLLLALDYLNANDQWKLYARTNVVVGNMNLSFGRPERSLEFYQEALDVYEAQGEVSLTGGLINNFGLAYMDLGDTAKSREYFMRSMVIRMNDDNKVGVGQVLNNLGTLMLENDQPERALRYFQRGLETRKVAEAPYSSIGESSINIGKAYEQLGDLENAIKYFKRGYAIGEETTGMELERRASQRMLEVYFKMGDYQNAFRMQTIYYEVKDSLYGLELREDLLRQTLIHEYDVKMREDSIIRANQNMADRKEQEESDRRQGLIRNGLLMGFGLVLLIVFILFRRYREKQAVNKVITDQNAALEQSQHEITDSIRYAERIQSAILPSKRALQAALPESFVVVPSERHRIWRFFIGCVEWTMPP